VVRVSLLTAHASGAAPTVISDLDEAHLSVAKRLVPRVRFVLVDRDLDEKRLGAKIIATLGTHSKLVMDCTGVESSCYAGIYVSLLTTA
jgi:L-iditol 2-dehydrogenase